MAVRARAYFPATGPVRSVTSMKILIVGAQGKLGRTVDVLMRERGHEVVTAGRSSGDIRCDIAEKTQLARLWEQAGQVDACLLYTSPSPRDRG